MFFEFESSNSNTNNSANNSNNQVKSSPSSSIIQRKSNHNSPPTSKSSSPTIPSPLVADNSHSSPSSSNNISQISIITNQQRHRRYSMHSCPASALSSPLDKLKDNSRCDLALITKKKLELLNYEKQFSGIKPLLKSLDERFVEPDVKLNQTFNKHSSSDLRKEVLLASIQRSLSFSTEDLKNLSLSSKNDKIQVNKSNDNNGNNYETDLSNSSTDDDCPMDLSTLPLYLNNSSDSLISSELFNDTWMKRTDIPEIHRERKINCNNNRQSSKNPMGGSYMPSETHNSLHSSTTFTSTTSMAGSKNPQSNFPSLNNCRNYIKNLNTIQTNLNGFLTNMGNYYSRTSSSSNLTNTVQSSPIRISLKKRLYSTSPSKFSSNPYHTVANSIQNNKEFSSIYSPSSSSTYSGSGNMSPDWEISFKRLKVMHNGNEFNYDSSSNDKSSTTIDAKDGSFSNQLFTDNNPQTSQHKDLNELTQDFHRLKTPFT